jgi:uncharacterized cupin superfamily protein
VTLEPGTKVAAADVAVALEGDSGFTALTHVFGVEVGVWEHVPGTSTDTEVDEVFVVLAGAARINFVEPALASITIGPGDVVRLAEGMSTVWTVTETLRKVYVA